jgi:hypothetical protein
MRRLSEFSRIIRRSLQIVIEFLHIAVTPEDSERGANDAFWGEVLDIAASSQQFELPGDSKELTKYLDPKSK